ncbi:CAAD domain-containing protein [Gloeothece verrucosa]|uniref:Cyanobacterial aminoacyl-tRNA synthetase CAAD domain-containing protein n=1 Tax=Gloeothece verrucosa (strain PCC 7822) TaxID=497965 RepID=E0U9L6_GLOV7|nr:CAAD domain-containing protein [Gloeothece verrucosa]ADN13817.1 conserved hypothetical protein [Gloeothece verrucosa PCC 7822]
MSSQISLENQTPKTEASLQKVDEKASNELVLSSSIKKFMQVGWQMSALIEQIPEYWNQFWQAYQRPLILLGWILGTLVTLKVFLAVIAAINSLPLLAPLLKLIGLAYSLWFIFRYLLGFTKRQEILTQLNSFKEYIFGAS